MLDRWESEPLQVHADNPSFTLVKGDVLDRDLVGDLCKWADVVYHLASILGTSETVEVYDPEDVARTNIIGTLQVLKACRAGEVDRVIYPATPDVPWINPYKISKRACESFCQMFFREYGLNAIVLQLTNVYGPRERWLDNDFGAPYNYQKVVPTFILNAARNEPLPVYGDGRQQAVYIHVDDVVRAMKSAAERDGIGGEVIHVGTPEQVSVVEIAGHVIELTDSKSQVEYLPMRPGEIKLSISTDTSGAERMLGFTAELGIREGLKQTIPYYLPYAR